MTVKKGNERFRNKIELDVALLALSYQKSVGKKLQRGNMERNEIIIELYFIKKMKQKEIAEMLNISKYIVSRVLSKESKYNEEKERRKKYLQKDIMRRKLNRLLEKEKITKMIMLY